jgi:predicted dehydrogenase
MVRIGVVGIGFMGMIHYLAAQRLKRARVTAICSRDPRKLAGDWRGIRGNFGPVGEQMDLSKVKKCRALDEFLEDEGIDLVDICNPTALHAVTAMAALRAGKHVLVEKPIALATKDADAMLKAAQRTGKLLMVGQVLPFFPEFKYAASAAEEAHYGRLLAAHFKRVISRPDWSAEIADVAKTGGPAIDLHIHDTHFIGLLAGMPAKVFSNGIDQDGSVQYLTTQYLYDNGGPAISCSSGAVARKARPFVHGYEIFFERGTLVYESGTIPLTAFLDTGKTKQPKLRGGGDPLEAFAEEIQTAVDAVASNEEPKLLSGQLARDALVLCHKECQSVRTGKAVSCR